MFVKKVFFSICSSCALV